jgi:hypothetical protein
MAPDVASNVPLWVTLVGFSAPLIALAGSAVGYVVKLYQDASNKRRDRFFELMAFIDDRNRPIATKVAAVYALREFPEHKDFIIRFCETQRSNITGVGTELLAGEMDRTREFMQSQ